MCRTSHVFMYSTQALLRWHTELLHLVLSWLHLSHTSLHMYHLLTRQKSRSTVEYFLYVTVTWVSAAHITCPGPVSTVQTLASVDKDKPQPSLTWQSSRLCKSLIWHSCLTLNGVFLLTWQPFSQCYDRKLFMLCGTMREMHIQNVSGSASLTSLAIRNVWTAYWCVSPVLNQ